MLERQLGGEPVHGDLEETRYVPELLWSDGAIRSQYEEYLRLFCEQFGDLDPPFDRQAERLHYIPREHIDWTRENGFFQVLIPKEMGGSGNGTNPEQLFAAGYAACFHSALQLVARQAGARAARMPVIQSRAMPPRMRPTGILGESAKLTRA